MELAEAAHREALRDIQPRPERRASPFPGMPDLAAPFFPRDSTYGTLFAKLSRCVRQTILLEARLAAGAYDHAEPTVNGTPRAEPQRPAPQPQAPRAPENRPRLRPEQLEDDLAADASRPPAEILGEICAELGAAVEAGLSPGRPANTKLEQRPETRSAPRLSQAERATQLALQHGIPPPR